MKRLKRILISDSLRAWKNFIIFSPLILLATACGSSVPLDSVAPESDEAKIVGLVKASDFFSYDIGDDNGVGGAVYGLSKTELPDSEAAYDARNDSGLSFVWGRGFLSLLETNINVSIVGDEASVTVTHYVDGTLYVKTTDDGENNPWESQFEDILIQNGQFTRGDSGWHLAKISPLDISLLNSADQTVQVRMIRATVNEEVVFEATSSSELLNVPDELPIFLPDTEVLIEAEIANSTDSGYEPASYVFLHRNDAMLGSARDIMYDDGTHGDVTPSDNVFSITYTINKNPGRHFALVDVIDATNFMEENAVYNSTAWGMPYIVESH